MEFGLKQHIQEYDTNEDKKIIIKAINFSEIAHKDQTRKSGDPYIIHPIEVAKIFPNKIIIRINRV